MNNGELVDRLAVKAKVPRSTARAALDALADIARAEADAGHPLNLHDLAGGNGTLPRAPGASAPADPAAAKIDELVSAAQRHPLGLDFLLEGEPGAVAITFDTHVFHVEAARRRLGRANS